MTKIESQSTEGQSTEGQARCEKGRYFREHRGKFIESMKTMRKVDGVKDIQGYLNSIYPEGYLQNIRIAADTKRDHRLHLDDWGADTYMVVADFDGYTGQCVGYANFYEE